MFHVGLVKTTLVDYPGKVACSVFLPGCNMSCPYCYNKKFALASCLDDDCGDVTLKELKQFLIKRRKILEGVVLTGGEPLFSHRIMDLILMVKEVGLPLKIDTNGMAYSLLDDIISNKDWCPDAIGLDIKTSLSKYRVLGGDGERVKYALTTLQKFDGYIDIRTVLIPGLVGAKDLQEIKKLIPERAHWRLSPFKPGHCLYSQWNRTRPYSDEEEAALRASIS